MDSKTQCVVKSQNIKRHFFERHFKELNISQIEESVPGRVNPKTNCKEECESMALPKNRTECNQAGWNNGSTSYMNNDKTEKASKGPE